MLYIYIHLFIDCNYIGIVYHDNVLFHYTNLRWTRVRKRPRSDVFGGSVQSFGSTLSNGATWHNSGLKMSCIKNELHVKHDFSQYVRLLVIQMSYSHN